MEEKLLQEVNDSLKKGKRAALAMLTDECGSTPRKTGSTMAVMSDRKIYGSVGGGRVEFAIINKAMECIKKGESSTFEYKLTEDDLGMQCGGSVKGFIKVFSPKNKLIIVGAGHIGEKVNSVAKQLDFETVIIDDREEYANRERFKDADDIIVGKIDEKLKEYEFSPNDYVVIATRGHISDLDALRVLVGKDLAYVGMIGSTKKILYIMNTLKSEGFEEEDLKKIYSPMGLDIACSLPGEVAVSILSEIILIKNNGSLNHLRDVKRVWK